MDNRTGEKRTSEIAKEAMEQIASGIEPSADGIEVLDQYNAVFEIMKEKIVAKPDYRSECSVRILLGIIMGSAIEREARIFDEDMSDRALVFSTDKEGHTQILMTTGEKGHNPVGVYLCVPSIVAEMINKMYGPYIKLSVIQTLLYRALETVSSDTLKMRAIDRVRDQSKHREDTFIKNIIEID